jgi:hypothetical protein
VVVAELDAGAEDEALQAPLLPQQVALPEVNVPGPQVVEVEVEPGEEPAEVQELEAAVAVRPHRQLQQHPRRRRSTSG